MEAGGRRIVSIPYGAGVSDLQAFNRHNAGTAEFEATIRDAFDVLYREATESGSGRVAGLSLHPYIIGLPPRIRALERALAHHRSPPCLSRAPGPAIPEISSAAGRERGRQSV